MDIQIEKLKLIELLINVDNPDIISRVKTILQSKDDDLGVKSQENSMRRSLELGISQTKQIVKGKLKEKSLSSFLSEV